MQPMRCPYCHSKVNPFRLLTYTIWTLLKCSACQKKSKIKRDRSFWLLAGVSTFCGITLVNIAEENLILLIGIVPVLFFVILLATWILNTLEPALDKNESEESS